MKAYIKILGVLSGVIVIGVIGLIMYGLLYESGSSSDKIIFLSFLFPCYVLLHFIILHRFGFSINADYTTNQKRTILIITVISFAFLFTIPLMEYISATELSRQEKKFEETKNWSTDTTAYDYWGSLKTKYFEGKIYYQLVVQSTKPFRASLTGFTIHLLDKDGFLIEEIKITKYSTRIDKEREQTFGIESNANEYMDMEDYAIIGDWDLLVNDK